MKRSSFLVLMLAFACVPTMMFADFREHLHRFELGLTAGVGFYVGQKAPAATTHPDLLRVQSYDAIAFGERGTLRWPGIETFGFSVGYRIDTRWHVTLKAVRQRVCFAEYDSIISTSNVPEEVRSVYYNSMWHVDAMAEFNLLNYGNIMAPEQAIYNVVPYAYREVRADRTLYWIDVFPEEKSTFEEIMFVTQEGAFTSAVAEIESLYASHYRANDGFAGGFMVE